MTGSVIIVAYDSDRWIDRCVDSLDSASARAWRVILVDNGGNNRIDHFADTRNVRILRTPHAMAFAEANNFALVNGGLDGEYVCFLNQDTVSGPGWLDACVDLMERRPNVGAVMPLITNYEGTDWDEAFRTCARAAPELAVRLEAGPTAELSNLPEFLPVPEVTAAAMVVRAEALRKAGPFDPIYGSYYEDYDLCRRIAQAGYQVGICTRGRVGHFGGSTTVDRKTYLRRARWIVRNRVIYAARWKWKNRFLGLLRYCLVTMARDAIRSALGRSNVPLSAFVQGHWQLVPIIRRLITAKFDHLLWQRYLSSLAWPHIARAHKRTVSVTAEWINE